MPNSKNIFLKKKSDFEKAKISLPASKSIANRALIINALSRGNQEILNLSEARDTQTMKRLLESESEVLDVLDAGTTMRFLTAYLAITNTRKTLTGTARMKERPIKILVEALKSLGTNYSYLEKEGFPPIQMNSFEDSGIRKLSVNGNISSQYISALLMIGPLLKSGLELKLEGKIGSKPYIEMTLAVMKSYGVNSKFINDTIIIEPQPYKSTVYTVEPDWSAASYWYSLVALSNNSSVTLVDLKPESIQGDSTIKIIMEKLGVKTTFNNDGATLSKSSYEKTFEFDFTHCPDLAQTIAVICAVKGINATFTGLESLKIKETDRIMALQKELAKINAELIEERSKWSLKPGKLPTNDIFIETYDDHRMAMAFAPLCLITNVTIENNTVVNKSYPKYWKDYSQVGLVPIEV